MADFIEITDALQNVYLVNTQHIVSVSEKTDIRGTFLYTFIFVTSGVCIRTKEAYADVKQKILRAGEVLVHNADILKAVIE